MKKSYSMPYILRLLLLVGFYSNTCAQVSWVDTTITTSVTDEDVIINGSNTLGNSVTISAVESDVRVTLLDNATITGTGVTLEIASGVSTSGKKHHVTIAFSDKTLHITNSVTLKIGIGNNVIFYGGELSLENDSVLTN